MSAPAAIVAHIEERAVVLCLPPEMGGLRVSRTAYDVYRRFRLPRRIGEVLPVEPERRTKVLNLILLLADKGYLVPPEIGIRKLPQAPNA
jgi:hypothetical protein